MLKTLFSKSLFFAAMITLLVFSSNTCTFASSLQVSQGKVYVVLVGVENYQNLPTVAYAVNDVEALQDKLTKTFGFYTTQKFAENGKSGQMLVLSTGSKEKQHRPTRANILETFNHLNDILRPQDTLIVYWAGHGQEYANKQYLLTMDSDLTSRSLRAVTSVTIEDLKTVLNRVAIHRFIFFIDACRTDPSINSGDKPNPLDENFTRGAGTLAKEITQNGEYAILWACSSKQSAYPYAEENHGIFTYFLLEAMDRVKPLTMQAIATYVRSHVKDWSILRASVKGTQGKFEDLQEPWLASSGGEAIYIGDSRSAISSSAKFISLKVKANVPNAQIMVDGKVLPDGIYSAELSAFSAVKRRMKVLTSAPGYVSDIQFVTLEPGESLELPIKLEAINATASLNPSGIGTGHIYHGSKPMEPVQGDIWINPKDGAEMVYIPSGQFMMGSTEADITATLASNATLKRENFIDEIGQHRVHLDGYYIYRTPVTVKQYKQYCVETARQMPEPPEFNPSWSKEDHPIVNVSWEDTQGYCRWAGVSLPTEAQWEMAARGSDGRKFPWGNLWDGNKCANSVTLNKLTGTMPIRSFPNGVSPYGVLDMAGNVWQWCSDWYGADYYNISPPSNPIGPVTGDARILRGGSWRGNTEDNFRCTGRNWSTPISRYGIIGFRCATSAVTR